MASIQVKGIYKLFAQRPDGLRIPLLQGREALLGPGGSPDGAIANTPEKI